MKLPDVRTLQEFLAFPLPWPFDPCSLPRSQMILMGWVSHWPESRPAIAAMHPSLVKGHLQPVGMIAASCRWPPTAAQLEAPIGSQEAATALIQIKNRAKKI